jgi:putative transposase
MKRRRFSEDQIVRILEEFEAGKSVEELCREYNVARSTIYLWRKKYGGLDKPLLKKLKELDKENARLKKIVAQQALDIFRTPCLSVSGD